MGDKGCYVIKKIMWFQSVRSHGVDPLKMELVLVKINAQYRIAQASNSNLYI